MIGLLNPILSCKKSSTPHYTIPEEFKAWSVFQKGSYWIYFNSVTQSFDSTYVTDNSFQTLSTHPQKPDEPYQYDEITILFSSIVYHKFEITGSYSGASLIVYVDTNDYAILSSWFLEDPTRWSSWGKAVFPNFVLNGKSYINVYKTEATYYNIHSMWVATDCYWSRNLGIIQIVNLINHDTTLNWSLLRYNIVQRLKYKKHPLTNR